MHEIDTHIHPRHPGLIFIRINCKTKDREAAVSVKKSKYVGKPVYCPACGAPIEIPELSGGKLHD